MDRGIEIAFNWIFSVIAGAIILTFMIYFAVQNTDLFGNLTANKVAFELDNVFSGYQTTLVETNLEFNKDIKLEFKCENNKEKVLINDKGRSVLRDKIIFAPSVSKGNKFYLLTKEWKVPYKVANFIFLTNSSEKYNLVGEPEDFEFPNSLRSNDGKNIEFTSSGCNSGINKITISYTTDIDTNEYYGLICTSKGKYGFYGEAMVYAAIFSDDFDCLYGLMMDKLNLVSSLYDKKASLIDNLYIRTTLKPILQKYSNADEIDSDFINDVIIIKNYNEERAEQNAELLY